MSTVVTEKARTAAVPKQVAMSRTEPTMIDPPRDDALRARMQGIRCDIDRDLEDVSANARSMVDWKHYVKTYPWICLGTAAALGFLIVPKRSAAANADVTAASEPAKAVSPVVNSSPTATRGLVDAIVAAAVSVAVREAIAYFGPSVEKFLGITQNPATNHHDSN